jgi:hypothetical protein
LKEFSVENKNVYKEDAPMVLTINIQKDKNGLSRKGIYVWDWHPGGPVKCKKSKSNT